MLNSPQNIWITKWQPHRDVLFKALLSTVAIIMKKICRIHQTTVNEKTARNSIVDPKFDTAFKGYFSIQLHY